MGACFQAHNFFFIIIIPMFVGSRKRKLTPLAKSVMYGLHAIITIIMVMIIIPGHCWGFTHGSQGSWAVATRFPEGKRWEQPLLPCCHPSCPSTGVLFGWFFVLAFFVAEVARIELRAVYH